MVSPLILSGWNADYPPSRDARASGEIILSPLLIPGENEKAGTRPAF